MGVKRVWLCHNPSRQSPSWSLPQSWPLLILSLRQAGGSHLLCPQRRKKTPVDTENMWTLWLMHCNKMWSLACPVQIAAGWESSGARVRHRERGCASAWVENLKPPQSLVFQPRGASRDDWKSGGRQHNGTGRDVGNRRR